MGSVRHARARPVTDTSAMTERRPRGRPRAFDDKTDQNRIQSLDRAMRVLEELATTGARPLSDLANGLGESAATVYRVLVTLEARGIVELDPFDQTWSVGPAAFRIGSAFLRRTSVVERARPILRSLMADTGETANLGVARGDAVLFVAQAETHESLRAFFPPGTLSPLHASGIGKALLAEFDPDRLATYLDTTDRVPFTAHTLTAAECLRADLAQIRERGYALDNEERNEGMRCVAAPVFNALGEAVAGLSISGPTSRVTADHAADLGRRVAAAAQALSHALGAP